MKSGDFRRNFGQTTELVITLSGDKDPIKVKSAKTTSIIEALESKVGPRVEEGVPPSPDAEPAADAPQTDTEGDSSHRR